MTKMTDGEIKKAWQVVGVVLILGMAYVLLSIANIMPAGFNIFEVWGEEAEPVLIPGEGYIDGFPDEVNVTAQLNNTYPIRFVCNESYVDGMQLTITLGSDLTNTSVYWTATSTDWEISSDMLEAEYIGNELGTGVEIDTLVLHVDGGDEEGDVDIEVITKVGILLPDEVTIDIVV